jgi:FkbM family methyltransferase
VGLGLLGGVVRSVVVESSWVGSLGDALGGWLDVLVVDEGVEGFSSGDVVGLIGEARGLGASVVGVSVSGGDAVWSGLVDVVAGVDGSVVGDDGLVVAPSVDVRVVNPIGFRRVDGGRFAVVGSVSPFRDGFDGLVELVGSLDGVDVLDSAGVGGGVSWPGGVAVVDVGGVDRVGLISRLRGYVGVVDHPALYRTVVERALWLVSLAAAGVPVVAVELSDELVGLLGDELVGVLGSVSVEVLLDVETRDRVSVVLRRVALRVHSRVERWVELCGRLGVSVGGLPLVSVVLATNRPEYVEFAVSQVARQSYPNRELVLVLHGDGFDDVVEGDVEVLAGCPVSVVRVGGDVVFGEVLNLGVAASSGVLVAKMDDDDWYGSEHLWDLVLAMEYSGASLVGKGAEFVYLEELDITVRRNVNGSETNNTTIGGGTLMIRRLQIDGVGGWRRVSRSVDQGLIEDVKNSGGSIFRTHGFGYVLNRRREGHTWDIGVDYFLPQSDSQWRGVSLDEALISQTGRAVATISSDPASVEVRVSLADGKGTTERVWMTVTIGDDQYDLVGHEGEYIRRTIGKWGLWEPTITRCVVDILRLTSPDEGVVVDVGAHIGYYSLLAANFGYETHAIEPLFGDDIRRAVQRNGRGDLIHVHDVALGSHPSVGGMYTFGETGLSYVSKPDEPITPWHAEKAGDSARYVSDIPILTLDELTADLGEIVLLKIDVEGQEPAVLDGFQRGLERQAARWIQIEVTPRFLGVEGATDLADRIAGFGYEIFELGLREAGRYPTGDVLPNLKRVDPTGLQQLFSETPQTNLLFHRIKGER